MCIVQYQNMLHETGPLVTNVWLSIMKGVWGPPPEAKEFGAGDLSTGEFRTFFA